VYSYIQNDWQKALNKKAGAHYAAIISDSHFSGVTMPEIVEILRALKPDAIFHCGDLVGMRFLQELGRIAEVFAVAGNCDDYTTTLALGKTRSFEFHGLKVGLTHGDMGEGIDTPRRALSLFAAERPELLCFGHSHQPFDMMVGNTRLYNPGSCARPRGMTLAPSFGWLEISEKGWEISTFYTKNVQILK